LSAWLRSSYFYSMSLCARVLVRRSGRRPNRGAAPLELDEDASGGEQRELRRHEVNGTSAGQHGAVAECIVGAVQDVHNLGEQREPAAPIVERAVAAQIQPRVRRQAHCVPLRADDEVALALLEVTRDGQAASGSQLQADARPR